MASKRFDELIENASPELKSRIAETGKEALTRDGIENDQPINRDLRPIDRVAEQSRPYAAAPEPSHGPANQTQPERRIDRAMSEKAQAQAAEQGKEATKSGVSVEQQKAPPAKEPER